MAGSDRMIVFSDLDGSLLDHETYDWQPARPALDELRRRNIPVVLVSSKTLAELADYRAQLGLQHPVVAENGAALHIPDNYYPVPVGSPGAATMRSELQSAYAAIKCADDLNCEAFFELGVPGIMRETGLTEEQARRANDRIASEPILWLDSDERAAQFEQQMNARGLHCIRGGRFLHLTGDTSKASAVLQLLDAYAQKWPDTSLTSVSLGDGPNDLGMLASTDIAVVIRGQHEHSMMFESQNRILKPNAPGPRGWNEAMLALLAEQQDRPPQTNRE